MQYAGYSSQHTGLLVPRHVEKELATHSSILAWKIPWTEEPGGPRSMGSQRVGWTRLSDLTFFLSRGILVPRPGTEPTSPALRGRF